MNHERLYYLRVDCTSLIKYNNSSCIIIHFINEKKSLMI